MKDHSYLGSGKLLIREFGAAAPFVEVGNVSSLTFSPQEEKKNLVDHTNPGGGNRNEVARLTGVESAVTFHDFSAENFGRFMRGSTTAITAGTATAEEVVAYKGGFTPLGKIATGITSVTNAAGSTTYDAGDDYVFQDGGIFIPDGSDITNPSAGAANIKVTYTYAAQKRVEALTQSAKQYELLFAGLNEAQSGKRVRIRAHKVAGGLLASLGVIGEEYGAGEVTGGLMADTTKGAGLSQYFSVELEDVV